MKVGDFVQDELWHFVSLIKQQQRITIKLDNQLFVVSTPQKYVGIQLNEEQDRIYIGGVSSVQSTQSLSKKNFKGCLTHSYFNRQNIVGTLGRDGSYQVFENVSLC